MSAHAALKRREVAKREAAWDPRARWQAIQNAISWADAQALMSRNTPARCLAAQRRHAAGQAAAGSNRAA